MKRGIGNALILLIAPKNREDTVKHQWQIVNNMGDCFTEDPLPERYDLIIDAIVDYGLNGEPRENLASSINRINSSETPILSLDVPSGLDATNGIPYSTCTKAASTLTLALPNRGLLTEEAKPFVGELYLVDISVPQHLYERMSLKVGPIFNKSSIIKIF